MLPSKIFISCLGSVLSLAFAKTRIGIDYLVAFGDSIIDDGVSFIRNDFYGFQQYSDGPTFPVYLAQLLGVDYKVYAFGGATSGLENYHFDEPWSGIAWQIEQLIKEPAPTKDRRRTLIVYQSGGANDLWKHENDLDQIVANNYSNVRRLLASGFMQILLLDNVDLSLAPWYRAPENVQTKNWHHSATLYMASIFPHKVLQPLLNEFPTADITFVKIKPLLDAAFEGFPNNTDPYSRGPAQLPKNRFSYLYHDLFHFRTKPHFLMAQALQRALENQTRTKTTSFINKQANLKYL